MEATLNGLPVRLSSDLNMQLVIGRVGLLRVRVTLTFPEHVNLTEVPLTGAVLEFAGQKASPIVATGSLDAVSIKTDGLTAVFDGLAEVGQDAEAFV